MKTVLIFVGVIVIFGIMFGGCIIGGLNRVVTLDEAVTSSWAQVENQLQRRYDLIPNLVNTVKGFAQQERDVFVQVTEARSKVGGAGTVQEKINANNQLTGALSRLLLVAERYPDLKSNQNFIRLQDELAGTENRIAVERKRYNDSVRAFNTHIRKIPGSFFASLKGLTKRPYFEVDDAAKTEVPEVEF